MRFLPDRLKEEIMLINVMYHRPTKDTDYTDQLDIVYKDLTDGSKHIKKIVNPTMDVYFAKEHARNFNYNRDYIRLEDAEMRTFKFKELPFRIAEEAGEQYVKFVNEARKVNPRSLNNIHKYKHVFGSDYDIESWTRIMWAIENAHNLPKPLTKMYLDIETDTIEIENGYGGPGECPVNAVSVVDEVSKTVHVFLLRNENNPLIQEFEEDISAFIDELHEAFDEFYGELDYQIYMFNDEVALLKNLFRLINTLKRDFLLIWNMGFDIPYIIARLIALGEDPADIMCHKDFNRQELFYSHDKRNFNIQNKGDYFKISSYTAYADQMLIYAGNRKGRGEKRSYKLNHVALAEIDDTKLDYSEEADMKTLAWRNYRMFVMYNIKDTLLQMGIENKTHDVDNVYRKADANATQYHKIFKQTVFLKNRTYIEYIRQGLVIGNNTNIDYAAPFTMDKDKSEEEDEKFDGALVADPMLNRRTGISVFGKKSMFIFDDVIDEDFGSMYPNITIAFNIAPCTMIAKLIIDRDILDIYNDSEGKVEDLGKEFVDNLLIGNHALMGSKWFNLPTITDIARLAVKHFEIRKRVDITSHVLEPMAFLEEAYITAEVM